MLSLIRPSLTLSSRWGVQLMMLFMMSACSSTAPTESTEMSSEESRSKEALRLVVDESLPLYQPTPLQVIDGQDQALSQDDEARLEIRVDDVSMLMVVRQPELRLVGLRTGTTQIQLFLDDQSTEPISLTVIDDSSSPTAALVLTVDEFEVPLGESIAIHAALETDDEFSIDVTDQVVWGSSETAVASQVSRGIFEIRERGRSTISASLGELNAEVRVGTLCTYPEYDREIDLGQIFPPVGWRDAYSAEGGPFDYDLRDLYCDFTQKPKTIAFIVGAGWCSGCTTLTVDVLNPIAARLENLGMVIIYLEAENGLYEPADGRYAQRHLDRLIEGGPGIYAGDAETYFRPNADEWASEAEFFRQLSSDVYPLAWVIDTQTMTVIASQDESDTWLPFEELAAQYGANEESMPASTDE